MRTARTLAATLIEARVFWQLCLGLLLLSVGFLALHPTPPAAISSGWDKLNHVLAFAALSWSGYLGLAASSRRTWPMIVGLLAFGALIELAQLIIPGRAGEWADLLADAIGTACGSSLAMLFYHGSRGRGIVPQRLEAKTP